MFTRNLFKRRYITRYTLSIAILTLSLGIASTPSQAQKAQTCRPNYVLGAKKVQLPCVDWLSDTKQTTRTVYQMELVLENADLFLFKLGQTTPLSNPKPEVGAIFNVKNRELYIPAIPVQTAPNVTQRYSVTLQGIANDLLSLTVAKLLPNSNNKRPIATSFSQTLSTEDIAKKSYHQITLKAKDEDNDTLAYELLSAPSGKGYSLAYLDSTIPALYVIIKPQFFGTIALSYRVTDGQIFSNPAAVTLTIENVATDSSLRLGSQRIEAREFAGFRIKKPKGRTAPKTGSSASQQILPERIDLSAQFPSPRDQGNQNSCVGWATAYVKTYHEAIEIGWPPNQETRIFSPAFIYNQINRKTDHGAKIPDALDLVVNKGAVTWAIMPYDAQFGGHLTQPNEEAETQAKNYVAKSWGTLRSENDIKTALSNRQPVIVSMAIFDTFLNLKGPNSVYNTKGEYLGDHAVVIVGYDDNYPGGGAYQLINSWGLDWGDKGFFWVPYSFLPTPITIAGENKGNLFAGAYILLDAKNLETISYKASPSAVEEMANLPNLEIMDWQVDYDPQSREGRLLYQIANTGTEKLAPNTTILVDLMLINLAADATKPGEISFNNYEKEDYHYVGSEEISAQLVSLAPGEAAARDKNHALEFTIDPSIPEGDYYPYLVVTGYDDESGALLQESNQTDNIKWMDSQMTLLPNSRANIGIAYWFAEWDYETQEGWLEYYLGNDSEVEIDAGQNWDIRLVLRTDVDSEGNPIEPVEYTIWQETVADTFWPSDMDNLDNQDYPFALALQDERGFVNIHQDIEGNPVPAGEYEVIFKVDGGEEAWELGQSKIQEADESDNTSYSGIWFAVEPEEETGNEESESEETGSEGSVSEEESESEETGNEDSESAEESESEETGNEGSESAEEPELRLAPENLAETFELETTRRLRRATKNQHNGIVKAYNGLLKLGSSSSSNQLRSRKHGRVYPKTISSNNRGIFPIQRITRLK